MEPLTTWIVLGGFFLLFLWVIGQPVYIYENTHPLACIGRGIKLMGKFTIIAALVFSIMWAASSI